MSFAAGNKLLAAELNALPQVIDAITTNTNGTASSASVEKIDIVLGTVQGVFDGATKARVELLGGTVAATGTAGDHFTIRIRDGGSAAPTDATPGAEIAQCPIKPSAISGSGQEGFYIGNVFTPTAGTHIFAVSVQRDAVAPNGTGMLIINQRQLVLSTAGPA